MESEQKVLTKEQITAIQKAQEIGRALAKSNPEIVDYYREGAFQRDIALRVVPDQYGRSEKVAVGAVGYALRILLSDDELERLGNDNRKRSSIAVGEHTLQKGKGIHAQTLDERAEAAKKGFEEGLGQLDREVLAYFGRKGGKKAAKTNEQQGTGIYGLSDEQRQEIGRRNGQKNYENGVGIHAMTPEKRLEAVIKGLHSQGKVPFTDEEKITLVELASNPAYQHTEGARQPGKPNYEKIRAELLDRFGVERTVLSLRTIYWRINKTPPPL